MHHCLGGFVLKTKHILLIVVACLLLVGVVSYFSNLQRNRHPVEVADSDSSESVEVESSDDFIVIGGVRRRRSDVEREKAQAAGGDKAKTGKRHPMIDGYGTTPPVAIDVNPQVAAAAKAYLENTHPERLSPLVQPAAFDLASYKKDPQPYLDTVEPGRVFQPAQPGDGVSEIRRRSPSYQQVVQGEPVKLAVRAEVGAPVTFTSFDLGRFSNQLTSTTVAADAEGLAVAEFVAPPGTISKVNILAASPLHSGQIKFIVDVSLPQ